MPQEPRDAWSGDHMGFYSSLSSVDRTNRKGTRSYSAVGYLLPNLSRSNLRVICEAMASSLILDKTTGKGLRFFHGQQTCEVRAKEEVIVCCGVIGSPQLLKLSGIGDPHVLKAAGVECRIESLGVGNNFQDLVASPWGTK